MPFYLLKETNGQASVTNSRRDIEELVYVDEKSSGSVSQDCVTDNFSNYSICCGTIDVTVYKSLSE